MITLIFVVHFLTLSEHGISIVTSQPVLDDVSNSSSLVCYPMQDMDELCTTICQTPISQDLIQGGKIPLYFSAFFEVPGGSWDGSGCIPAIEMALDHINARTDILPEYELRAIWGETKCDAVGSGTRALFDQLFHDPTKLLILGGGCSPSAIGIASTAHYWNLITIAYGAESPELSNRILYPDFYRTASPATVFNYVRIRLLKEYGWTRVATIYENHEHFQLTIDHLHNLLREANISVVSAESFFDNPRNQVKNLKRNDAKIIIGNMFEDKARRLFCEAYKEGLTGKGYVWMMLGWYEHKFWEIPDDNVDCTVEEMERAVRGYIGISGSLLNDLTTQTVANITPAEYISLLKSRLTQPENLQYDYTPWGTNAYDGVWTIGLMLHEVSRILKTMIFSDNTTRSLDNFTYDDLEMKQLFFDSFANVQFEGVSGPVSFIEGDRLGLTQFEQLEVGCLEGWVRNGINCYIILDTPLPWMDAEKECTKLGANLASITMYEDFSFVQKTLLEGSSWLHWIGLHLEDDGGQWIWTDTGRQVEWLPPGISLLISNSPSCMAMDADGSWQAAPCNMSLHSICKSETELADQTIGYYDIAKSNLRWVSRFTWPDDEVPLDHTPKVIITRVRVHKGIPYQLYIFMCVVASLCIVMALGFLAFNIKFRNQRFVKLSSPNLNNVIIMGSILIYVWVVVSGIDNTLVSDLGFYVACQIRGWLISIGFVLAFGALFSKTWRIYRVATFDKPKRRIITDRQLFLMVAILLIIDVIILLLRQCISPSYIASTEHVERADPEVPNQVLAPHNDYCTCSFESYWILALCGFKGILLIFGMFLAWETRKVRISALNDSKLIGISVYNVVILSTVGTTVSLIIYGNPSAAYGFTAGIAIFCTSLTLIIVFVPKIISVYKYPDGKPISTIRESSNKCGLSGSSNDGLSSSDSALTKTENINLRKRIVQLEDALRKAVNASTATYAIETPATSVTLANLSSSDDQQQDQETTMSKTQSDSNLDTSDVAVVVS